MFRIIFWTVFLPLRALVFIYFRLRSLSQTKHLEISIRSDFSETPLSTGIWAYLKPAKDRFYLFVLELHGVLVAVKNKRLKIENIAVTFESNSLGWAQAWEVRSLLSSLRAEGVRIDGYLLAEDKISLFMASACERIFCPESLSFDLSPFTSESIFLSSFLSKVGVRPQFFSVGEFKSAAEIFTRKNMSPAARKQTEDLLQDIERTFFEALQEKAPTTRLQKKSTILSANDAVQFNLIDKLCALTEFREEMERDGKSLLPFEKATRRLSRKQFRLFPLKKLKRIAVVVAEGNIIEATEPRPGSINFNDYRDVARTLSEEKPDGVLLRVNSPGGSATVSQLLWREWMLATQRILPEREEDADKDTEPTKPTPVFVSQGNVAASGGYYLSALGTQIFSTPVSITGSIGVVGGKFNVSPLLKKWGVDIDRAPKKNSAPFFSSFADFAPEQKKAIERSMLTIYDQFVRDVALGRGKKKEEILPLASGHVYSGIHAKRIALADSLGGLTHALAALKAEMGVKEKTPVELVFLPVIRETLFSRVKLPFGLSKLLTFSGMARPGVYALDLRFLSH